MAGYALNITAFFLAFAAGSLISFQFYPTAEDKTATVPRPTAEKSTLVPHFPANPILAGSPVEDDLPKKPFCRDPKILPVWNELRKDEEFKDRVGYSRDSADCSDMLEISFVDLNKDGKKEILLRGANFQLCSAVGNCGFWIFQKTGRRYKKILVWSDYIDITEMGDQIEKSRTNGYADILLKGHMDASNTHYFYFGFNGRKYAEKKCMVEAYVPGSSPDPKWKFVTCREFERNYNGR